MAKPWTVDGNAVSESDFLGTTNAEPLSIRTNDTERVTVRPDGNVGVGRTDPEVRLHVTGNRLRLDSASRRLDLRADGAALDVQSDTHNLYLHSNGPSGRNNVIINPFGGEGNVGIGNQGPQTKLHVTGNRIRLQQATRRLDLRADGAALDVQSDTHSLYLHSNGPSGRNHVIMNPFGGEGNVGIGTQSPSDKLHVAGNVRANDLIIISDARLKAEVTPVTGALEKLQKLRAVNFTREAASESDEPVQSVGVLAQEVESVLPELVNEPEADGYKGVSYSGMVAILLEACKEVLEENRALSRRVEALERAATG